MVSLSTPLLGGAIHECGAVNLIMQDAEFNYLSQLAFRESGIVINESKRDMLYGRVMKRIRHLKLNGFTAYCQLLQDSYAGELSAFINAITTNLTAFFREEYHFDFLKKVALANFKHHNQDKRLRIWSAGCSTGQEPYSIAMSVQGQLPDWDVKILATDLDSEVLWRAHQGRYDDLMGVPLHYRSQYCADMEHQHRYGMDDEIKQLIAFKQLNLLSPWPMSGLFDAIFCRNVLIYFDNETKRKLIQRFYSKLKPGGYLFLGHSESLQSSNTKFKLVGQTIYQR
ncbi:protein-glutamate O-methyltransferase CheR [Moritella sp. F3]|uniref:CheR family methyltransferase n=1 Tax=Moritella sp. F3 TaxID=2718882 RepID=UPI0018E17F7B|nr:protein-glutamate O-methyltransferase CheR [Moritella sp. F3]GIC77445.1 chemotaxis protein methyltransferase [Moritella sp. F1]GIC83368.1 chemotaxis protein methyltransferase [Moritella sp. F3]